MTSQSLQELERDIERSRAQLDLQRKKLRDAIVRAPYAGSVKERAVNVGQYGNDARWVATIPTATLSAQANVAIWADATSNGPGGLLWDSRNGQNYVTSTSAASMSAEAQSHPYETSRRKRARSSVTTSSS